MAMTIAELFALKEQLTTSVTTCVPLDRKIPKRKPIIATTVQQIGSILEEIKKNHALRNLRVAFLIEEAHRSQEGKTAAAIRTPFRSAEACLDRSPTGSDVLPRWRC